MRLTSPFRGLSRIRQSKEALAILGAGIALNAAQWLFLAVHVRPQADPIPLHYTITFGIDRIGPWYSAFLLPLSGTIMLGMNIVLTSLTVEHQRVTAMFIAWLSLLMQLTLLAAAVFIFRAI